MRFVFIIISLTSCLVLLSSGLKIEKLGSPSHDEVANVDENPFLESSLSLPPPPPPPPPSLHSPSMLFSGYSDGDWMPEQRLIKNAHIEFSVKEIFNMKDVVDSILSEYDGYYEKDQFEVDSEIRKFHLNIKVQEDKFEQFIEAIELKVGDPYSKLLKVEDNSNRITDLAVRLEAKRSFLIHYNELLQRANTVKESAEIVGKISMLEEDVGSLERRFNRLENQVLQSFIYLRLTEFSETTTSSGNEISTALMSGISMVWKALLYLLSRWPIVLIVPVILILIRKFYFQKRRIPV